MKRAKRNTGMTIIELLVVCSIIAILASMLLPAVTRAKGRATAIGCMSSVRQLQAAWLMYCDENREYVPLNTAEFRGHWRSTTNSWTGPSNAVLDRSISNIMQGSLWRYVGGAGPYRCPADKTGRTRSYGLNGNLGGRTNEVQTVIKRSQVLDEPGRLASFICENEDSIDDGHFLVWPYPDDRWVNMPSDRHAGSGVLAFCDGRAEKWVWKHPKKFRPNVDRTNYWKRAVGEADLHDLRKLQSHALLVEEYRRQP